MTSTTYKSNQLISIIESLLSESATGILSLKTQVTSEKNQRSCILVFNQGVLTFGDTRLPANNQQLARTLGKEFKSDMFESALSVTNQKITDSKSFRELVELLTRLKVFSWKQVEVWATKKVILKLEHFLSYPGESQWQADNNFDLLFGEDKHGLNWSYIKQQLSQRQQKWNSFLPVIPGMDAIPITTSKQLKQIDNSQVKQHLASLVNGSNTLLDISETMSKDPLKVAKTYLNWFDSGWISFKIEPKIGQNLPIVLSLDDSPIIQTMIKRALQKNYRVLLSNNAKDALSVLKEHQVNLLLLDLTLPDMDGLEFCKIIRKIPQLEDLPIVMVTGRDGLVDRAKGRFAGTNQYLTKPFKPEELRRTVAQYVKNDFNSLMLNT